MGTISIINIWIITVQLINLVWNMMNSSSRRIRKWPAYCTSFFFFHQGFLSRTLTTHRTAGEGGGDHLSFHSTTSTHSCTFRHLFATLLVRRLSHIFNRSACIYQTATWGDLPPYRDTIWFIDDVMLIFVC